MFVAVFSLPACNAEMLHASAPVRIKDPWLRLQPETNSGELYFYLTNKSLVDDALIEARSEKTASVEFYNSIPGQSFSSLEPVAAFELPVESGLILLPDGPHIKLVGLDDDLAPGRLVPITLKFEQAGEFSFYVEAH
jgi:copper(I)-binding protein